ncbi:hypothetical protein B296_00053078, partial [Ensete ventricosum]
MRKDERDSEANKDEESKKKKTEGERDQSAEPIATTAPHMPSSIKPDSATSTTDPSFVLASLFPWASTPTSLSLSLVAAYVIDGGRGHGQLHRYPPGHHPPSTGCLPQVRMPGICNARDFSVWCWREMRWLCCLLHAALPLML